MEEGWIPTDRGYVDKRNRAIVKRMPSILSDKTPCDPHHYPLNQSQGGGEGLLEMVPLTREEHDLATKMDAWTLNFIEANAPAYFRRVYLRYSGSGRYLGPPERVAEVRDQVETDIHRKRRALGVA